MSVEIQEEYREDSIFRYSQIPKDILSNADTILELGSGTGENQIRSTNGQIFLQKDYVGVDVANFEKTYLNTVQSDIFEFETDQKYDLVLAFEIFEHIPVRDIEQFVDKLKSFCKDGGYIILTTPYRQSLIEYIESGQLDLRYYQIHNIFNIDENIMSQFFPGANFIRLRKLKTRKKFWLSKIKDWGLMTIYRMNTRGDRLD